MSMTVALAGNPNSGKTTLFNTLTGSNQFIGNWPGVTIEKKEGKLKKNGNITIVDLPGIYSLSPYTLEEMVARNYLIKQKPGAILNIIDGTNLERNLYLTTQLAELGIPVVVAVNMMDIVAKKGDVIDIQELSIHLGYPVIEISALKETGISELVDTIIKLKNSKTIPMHIFTAPIEQALAHIEELTADIVPAEQQRWYTVKLFERDERVLEHLNLDESIKEDIEKEIALIEAQLDDDAESIITGERYIYITSIINLCYEKRSDDVISVSDKIDGIVTNRILGLPIFAAVMFLVYYISMVTFGAALTEWIEDNLFGSGFHITGGTEYAKIQEQYDEANNILKGYQIYTEANAVAPISDFEYEIIDEKTLEVTKKIATREDYADALSLVGKYGKAGPDPKNYGIFIDSVPTLAESLLNDINCAAWLKSLIVNGIIAGVGAVLGFFPQMLILFLLLAILEGCGYMARIAFVLDRIFRRFGLSGKSFIPMLVGAGCGVSGVMASRTIENERDRRMTIITTTFIPCGAKVPFIAMIAGAVFNKSAWVATSAYFVGMAAIVISGIILKKTVMFAGEPAPFVMEMPAYHLPTVRNTLRSAWERGWSFIKKAGTIILLSTVVVWVASSFGFTDDGLRMLDEDELNMSILAKIGGFAAWLFVPLGWGNWQAVVASVTGLVAKENIVGTMGILYGADGNVWRTLGGVFDNITGYSFLIFNLLCAPCFAAIGAIKREMNNTKWTWFAIGYQCGFAYVVAMMINYFGRALTGRVNIVGIFASAMCLTGMIYMLFRPYKEATHIVEG